MFSLSLVVVEIYRLAVKFGRRLWWTLLVVAVPPLTLDFISREIDGVGFLLIGAFSVVVFLATALLFGFIALCLHHTKILLSDNYRAKFELVPESSRTEFISRGGSERSIWG